MSTLTIVGISIRFTNIRSLEFSSNSFHQLLTSGSIWSLSPDKLYLVSDRLPTARKTPPNRGGGAATPRYGSGHATPDKHARRFPLPYLQAQPRGGEDGESGDRRFASGPSLSTATHQPGFTIGASTPYNWP